MVTTVQGSYPINENAVSFVASLAPTPPSNLSLTGQVEPVQGAAKFVLTRQVDLVTLGIELGKKFDLPPLELSASGPDDLNSSVSSGNPITLYVQPATLDKDQVQQVLDAHEVPEALAPDEKYVDVVAKAAKGESLDSDEIQIALRGLLNR